jgi:hypothetical protein
METNAEEITDVQANTMLLALIAVLTIAGCVGQGQFLDNKQEMAIQTARG